MGAKPGPGQQVLKQYNGQRPSAEGEEEYQKELFFTDKRRHLILSFSVHFEFF
jgi:hypothetical protein